MTIETLTPAQQQRATAAAFPHRPPPTCIEAPKLPPYARVEAPLARLAAELYRLSSNRDDTTAIAALELEHQLRAAGSSVTAQSFLPIYVQVYERRYAYGDPARGEWLSAYRLACVAFEALLWSWRLGRHVRAADADGPAMHAIGKCR